jgi:hypothetical protein
MAGSSKGLLKAFNRLSIPTTLFVIFCPGGIDFVGGYSYYQFLKQNLFLTEGSSLAATQRQLGKLKLEEDSGEAIHAKLFEQKTLKAPAYWRDIVNYY